VGHNRSEFRTSASVIVDQALREGQDAVGIVEPQSRPFPHPMIGNMLVGCNTAFTGRSQPRFLEARLGRTEQLGDQRKMFVTRDRPIARVEIQGLSNFNGLMSLESDPRWPAFIEKVTAAVKAGASATI
jgi:hypothetical protein